MNSNKDKARAWSNYWLKDFLTTFVDDEQLYYSEKIEQHWHNVFSKLKDSQHIVDLAAGNGALFSLAKNNLKNKNLTIKMTAIDLADISNSSFYQSHPDIQLISNTDINSIPLNDASIDLCVSQFGFEYSDVEKTCEEISRILKPNGKFSAVLHNASSSVSLHSESAIQQINLCHNSKLTDTSVKLLRRLQKLKKSHRDIATDPKAKELRDRFNAMAKRLSEYGDKLPDSAHINYFLNELGNLFSNRAKDLNLDQKLIIIKQLEIDSKNYHSRMLSMLEASNSQEQIEELKQTLQTNKFNGITVDKLTDQTHEYAWVLSATKEP